YDWQAKLEKHKLSSDDVYTKKQIRLTSPSIQPPKILFTQLKLFGDDWGDNTKITKTIVVNDPSLSHSSTRTVDIGLETICDLIDSDHKVSIPIYLEGSDTPSLVTYTVDSILCHTGDKLNFGHYTVLRFEKNGDVHYCDDDIVVNWQDHAKAKGVTSSAKTLTQFCREKKLSGYMFSLSLDPP
ncbi:MAG: hypothetical protein HAW66_02485, partial [Shewanella sp.]|nr:hypothetical protein [Shewanella sp.]